MNAQSSPAPGTFDHLREHSIGLPQTLFQSITHMAPGAAIAFSILVSVQFSGPALPLAVLVGLIACLLVANSIGQLAKQMPSAGGLYTYVSRTLGPAPGFIVGWVRLHCVDRLLRQGTTLRVQRLAPWRLSGHRRRRPPGAALLPVQAVAGLSDALRELVRDRLDRDRRPRDRLDVADPHTVARERRADLRG
jgi:Amino acid permease